MPNYAFIVENEQTIRQHFEETCTGAYATKSKSAHAIYKLLQSEPDMTTLAANEYFCHQIAEYFFDNRVIALFGDYRTLLSMPHKVQPDLTHGKYMQYSAEFLGDHDILLTMDHQARPAILLRLKFKNEEKADLMIVVQAHYSIHGDYYTGNQDRCLSYTALGHITNLGNSKEEQRHSELETHRLNQIICQRDKDGILSYKKDGLTDCSALDFETYREKYGINYLGVLQNLLKGETFYDIQAKGLMYSPAAKLIKQMHAADTIKSFIKMVPIQKAYKHYKSLTKSIIPDLFTQGRIQEAEKAMQEIVKSDAKTLKLN